jgi:HAD superfamily hydrolase (TIGR01509 family)
MGGVRAADLDAVTLDAYGTLVALRDPVPELRTALEQRGMTQPDEDIHAAFRTEVAYYREHSAAGHDEEGLKQLQFACAKVFLDGLGADLDADEFAPVYADAMGFDVLPGVHESLERLRALGLELAVVANWDLSLQRMLADAGIEDFFSVVVHAAQKPAPDGFLRALAALGVAPRRSLHVGDDDVDAEGAAAAGMHFMPAPVHETVGALG